MADISQLNLAEPDQIEWEEYQDGGTFMPPPPAGKYFGQAPPEFSFKATQQGKLKAVIDPITITGPTGQGYKVRFTNATATKFKNRMGSFLGDYLRAQGVMVQGNPTNQQYADLVEGTANRVFPFLLEWRGYCKDCDAEVGKTMADFPKDDNGEHVPSMPCPHCGKKVYANGVVRAFVSVLGG